MIKKITAVILAILMVINITAFARTLNDWDKEVMNPSLSPFELIGAQTVTLEQGIATQPLPTNELSLDGTWKMLVTDAGTGSIDNYLQSSVWSGGIDAAIPGSIHTALFEAGIIPDPTVGKNADIAKSYSLTKEYWLSTTFTVPEGIVNPKLMFKGVDYTCEVWLNGTRLGFHEGAFGGPDYDIESLIQAQNRLIVKLNPAPADWNGALKASSIYGWHYVSLPSLGIWQSVKLRSQADVVLDNPFIKTRNAQNGDMSLFVNLNSSKQGFSGNLNVTVSPKNFTGDSYHFTLPVTSTESAKNINLNFSIPNPHLWWPVDMGEQNLYKLDVSFTENTGISDTYSCQFGIRTIEMKPVNGIESETEYKWHVVVNGTPIFAKGTNWCIIDAMLRVKRENYERFLTLAKNQHIQMFRAWGGGLLETDEFYDLCDELGIMVYQEFPICFSLALANFNDGVIEEQATRNVERLRNRASLIMWGGGNEIGDIYGKPAIGDGNAVETIGKICLELDGTRDFHRSDPMGGSLHNYNVWWVDAPLDFNLALQSSFLTEFGLPSIPNYESVLKYIDSSESTAWPPSPTGDFTKHYPTFGGSGETQKVNQYAGEFAELESLPEVIVGMQLSQATGIRHTLERARTNYPNAVGAIFYKMNDNYPGMSWSTVDWFGVPKISYYVVQDAFQPLYACGVLNSLSIPSGSPLNMPIYLLDDVDELSTKNWEVTAYAYDSNLNMVESKSFTGSGSIEKNKNLGTFTVSAEKAASSPLLTMIELKVNNIVKTRATYWLNYQNSPGVLLKLPKTTLTSAFSNNSVTIQNTGSYPAFNVYFDCPEISNVFTAEDSYFWLMPGESRTLNVSHNENVTVKAFNFGQPDDTRAPKIKSLSFSDDKKTVYVKFSEKVLSTSLNSSANYSFSNQNISIQSVSYDEVSNSATVTTSGIPNNVANTLSIQNVSDTSGNTATVNAAADFFYDAYYWNFEDNSTDVLTGKFTGTLNGATYASVDSGKALGLTNGSSMDVYNANINLKKDFTISFWAKAQNPANGSYQVLLAKDDKVPGHFEIYLSPTGELKAYFTEFGDLATGKVISDSSWHHYAMTFNRDTVYMYVDGTQVYSIRKAGSEVVDSTATLRIGGLPTGTFPFTGLIDDVLISTWATRPADISTLMVDPWGYAMEQTGQTGPDNGGKDFNPGDAMNLYWSMDNNANEASEYKYDGRSVGVSYIDGAKNKAAEFTKSYSVIDMGETEVSLGSSFTISAWLSPSASTGNYRVIMAKGEKEAGHFELYLTPSNELCFYAYELGRSSTSGYSIPDSKWTHVAITYDGTKIRYYVDSALVGADTIGGTIIDCSKKFVFGGLVDGTMKYNGAIDEVYIKNSCLSKTDIDQLFGSQISEPQDIYHFDFNNNVADDKNISMGSFVGNTSFVDGKFGKAVSFNNSGVFIGDTGISFNRNFSVSMWVKKNTADGVSVLLGKGDKAVPGHFELYTTGSSLRCYSPDFGDNETNITLTPNVWEHIAMTYDGTTASFYKNGSFVYKKTIGSLPSGNNDISIGQLLDKTMSFDGAIDELYISKTGLSSSAVHHLYSDNYLLPKQKEEYMHFWSLDQSTADYAMHGVDGILKGNASYTQGKSGSAISLDGNGSYISLNENSGFDFGTEFTLSMWVKQGSNTGFNALFAKGDKSAAGHFELYTQDGNLRLYGTEINDNILNINLSDKEWHHVAIVFNGSEIVSYDNAVEKARISRQTSVVNSNNNLTIGSLVDGGIPFIGQIEDVMLKKAALDQTSISSVMNDTNAYVESTKMNQRIINSFNDGLTAGKLGNAHSFGTAPLNLGNVDINYEKGFTLSMYIKQGNLAGFQVPFSKGSKLLGNHLEIYLNNGVLNLFTKNKFGSPLDIQTTEALIPNEFNHVAIVYTGSKINLYLNGNLVESRDAISFYSNANNNISVGDLSPSELPFNGVVDELIIMDKVIDADEALKLSSYINLDVNDDSVADINIDTNDDNIADINIDTDGDFNPDTNISPVYDLKIAGSSNTITAKASVYQTGLDDNSKLLICIYKDGKMIAMQSKNAIDGTTGFGAIKMSLPFGFESGQQYSVKTFVWKNFATMTPYVSYQGLLID